MKTKWYIKFSTADDAYVWYVVSTHNGTKLESHTDIKTAKLYDSASEAHADCLALCKLTLYKEYKVCPKSHS